MTFKSRVTSQSPDKSVAWHEGNSFPVLNTCLQSMADACSIFFLSYLNVHSTWQNPFCMHEISTSSAVLSADCSLILMSILPLSTSLWRHTCYNTYIWKITSLLPSGRKLELFFVVDVAVFLLQTFYPLDNEFYQMSQ